MKKLTPKQELFCKEYLIDLNATQAAIRAGYSEKTAQQTSSENMSKPVIQEYVQQLMKKRSDKTEIDADYVLNGIKNVTQRCAKEGKEFNPASALKGYELLGKNLVLFTDKTEHSGEQTLKVELVNYGDDNNTE